VLLLPAGTNLAEMRMAEPGLSGPRPSGWASASHSERMGLSAAARTAAPMRSEPKGSGAAQIGRRRRDRAAGRLLLLR